jgi:hypothetical protein
MATTCRQTLIAIFILLSSGHLQSQQHLAPGVERWAIKTSIPSHPNRKTVPLSAILTLPNPISQEDPQFETKRIPIACGADSLREGALITTTGWLHLVALEDDQHTHRDGDYHMQIRTSAEWGDSCLVIEVPFSDFVSNQTLARQCGAVRTFIKEKILNGREPGTKGNKLSHAVYVKIKGQLFFDAPHVKGNPRGKRGMKSYTPWEINPVYSIKFATKPH